MSEPATAWCDACHATTYTDGGKCIPCGADLESLRASKREYRKAMYQRRKLAGVCIDCGAGLQEDDGLRCVEHTAAAKECALRYHRTKRVKERQSNQELRNRRRAAGQCAKCPRPVVAGKSMCQKHADYHRVAARDWARRKRAGVAPIAKAKRERLARRSRGIVEATLYRPIEERIATPQRRILRTMRFLDWSNLSEIFAACGAPEHDSRPDGDNGDREALTAVICRLQRSGQVERRGRRNAYDYRLTEAGRVAAVEARQVAA